MLGFEIDFWDYITFVAIFAVVATGLVLVLLIAGLPGRIAIARKHPDAEAVKIMGWAGLLAVVPWMQAFIWAFKPADTVDIRRFPKEEREAIAEGISHLTGASQAEKIEKTPAQPPPDDRGSQP
jgi:hypothetical protein